MIESSNNIQIKHLKKLKTNARYRKKQQLFLVEGWKMVGEALGCGLVEQVYLSASALASGEAEGQPGYQAAIPVSDKRFAEISDTKTPQGVLAIVRMPAYQMEDSIRREDASLLCLEGIHDPGNLGTMIRTAEGAGMAGVILSKDCVDLFHPKVVRATMGSVFRVPFCIAEDFMDTMRILKQRGFQLYAARLDGARSYTEPSYMGRTGILIGNEANGLTEETSELANWRVKIPMKGGLESLNASISAALLMYEILRKRECFDVLDQECVKDIR